MAPSYRRDNQYTLLTLRQFGHMNLVMIFPWISVRIPDGHRSTDINLQATKPTVGHVILSHSQRKRRSFFVIQSSCALNLLGFCVHLTKNTRCDPWHHKLQNSQPTPSIRDDFRFRNAPSLRNEEHEFRLLTNLVTTGQKQRRWMNQIAHQLAECVRTPLLRRNLISWHPGGLSSPPARKNENIVIGPISLRSPLVGFYPMHTTNTFKLDAVASELVQYRFTNSAERDVAAFVAHMSNRCDRFLQPGVLGRNLKVVRNVDTVPCAQANCSIASRRELMSSGWLEFHTRSSGFTPQNVSQALLAHWCNSPGIDQEIVATGFVFRYRIQILCRIGWHSLTLIRLYQHPSDRLFSRSVRNNVIWRCSVFPTPGALVPPTILLHVSQVLAEGNIQQSTQSLWRWLCLCFRPSCLCLSLVIFAAFVFFCLCLCPSAAFAFLAFSLEIHGYNITCGRIRLCSTTVKQHFSDLRKLFRTCELNSQWFCTCDGAKANMTAILTFSSDVLSNLCSYVLTSHSQLSIVSVVCKIDSTRFHCNKHCIRIRCRSWLLLSYVAFNPRHTSRSLWTSTFFTVIKALPLYNNAKTKYISRLYSSKLCFFTTVTLSSSIAVQRNASIKLTYADPMYTVNGNDHSDHSLCSAMTAGALPIIRVHKFYFDLRDRCDLLSRILRSSLCLYQTCHHRLHVKSPLSFCHRWGWSTASQLLIHSTIRVYQRYSSETVCHSRQSRALQGAGHEMCCARWHHFVVWHSASESQWRQPSFSHTIPRNPSCDSQLHLVLWSLMILVQRSRWERVFSNASEVLLLRSVVH